MTKKNTATPTPFPPLYFAQFIAALECTGYWADKAHNPPPFNPELRVHGIL